MICTFCSRVPDDLAQAESILRSKPQEAIEILENSPSKHSDKASEQALWCLLDVWARYNNYEKNLPLEELERACDYFLRRGSHLRKAQSYYVRSSVYQDQNICGDAQLLDDMMRSCLEIEKCDDDDLAALCWQHYGATLNGHKWFDKAVEALKKSNIHAERAGKKRHVIVNNINISHSYLFLGDADKDYSLATRYAEEACSLAESIKSQDLYSRALAALSSCHSRAGRFEDALKCSQKAVRIQEISLEEGIRKEPVRYISLADAWRKVGNGDSCLFYAMKDYNSENLATRTTATQLIYFAYRDLLNDETNAIEYLTQFHNLTNKLNKIKENDKVAANQVAFEKEILEKKHSNILLTILLSVLLAAVSFILVLRFYRLRVHKSEERLAKAIEKTVEASARAEEASKEAARVTAVLVDKDRFIEALREKPKYLSDFEWSRLEKTVDKVYDGWCTALRESGVSDGGIRTAICIKLHFSNADSATCLGISPASFVKAKQRLKQKHDIE